MGNLDLIYILQLAHGLYLPTFSGVLIGEDLPDRVILFLFTYCSQLMESYQPPLSGFLIGEDLPDSRRHGLQCRRNHLRRQRSHQRAQAQRSEISAPIRVRFQTSWASWLFSASVSLHSHDYRHDN